MQLLLKIHLINNINIAFCPCKNYTILCWILLNYIKSLYLMLLYYKPHIIKLFWSTRTALIVYKSAELKFVNFDASNVSYYNWLYNNYIFNRFSDYIESNVLLIKNDIR